MFPSFFRILIEQPQSNFSTSQGSLGGGPAANRGPPPPVAGNRPAPAIPNRPGETAVYAR